MVETTPTPLPALPNTYLDELVEQGGDELRLSMLLIEVSSCNDQADFALINRAYHFAKEHHKGQIPQVRRTVPSPLRRSGSAPRPAGLGSHHGCSRALARRHRGYTGHGCGGRRAIWRQDRRTDHRGYQN